MVWASTEGDKAVYDKTKPTKERVYLEMQASVMKDLYFSRGPKDLDEIFHFPRIQHPQSFDFINEAVRMQETKRAIGSLVKLGVLEEKMNERNEASWDLTDEARKLMDFSNYVIGNTLVYRP